MKKIAGVIYLLTGLVLSCLSQSMTDVRPDIITSPSPAASSLFKDVNIPLNYYTGTPEINIPLHTLKSGLLQIPINIKYTASGIRVEQDAGLVGLAWDLQTGGAIGRSIVGTPDENAFSDPLGAGYRVSATYMSMPDPGDDLAMNTWANNLSACNLQQLASGKHFDLSPDNYFMNFNGHSAKLFFDKNAKPYFSPYKPWKLSGNETIGYTVIIEDGTTYEFKVIEFSGSLYETMPEDRSSSVRGNTSWYLSRIISASKTDTINLSYLAVSYSPPSYNPSELHAEAVSGQSPVCGNTVPQSYNSTTTASHGVTGWLLKSISCKEERVDFYNNTGRTDFPDSTTGMPYKLDSIRFYALTPTSADKLMGVYRFGYDYYNSGGATISQRLRLISIQQTGPGNEAGETYRFSYNDSTLPDRNSKSQDIWGFPNRASNSTLIPSFTDINGITWVGANRSTDSTQAGLGLLNSIQYPTGGKTSFEYEANRYATNSKPGSRDSLSQTDQIHVSTGAIGKLPLSNSTVITISSFQYVTINYLIMESTGLAGEVMLTITNSSNTTVYSQQAIGSATSSLGLPADVYTITVSKGAADNTQFGTLNFTYTHPVASPYIGVAVGGARIRRMIQSDGTTQIIRRFSYLTDSLTSSGHILNQPVYGDYEYSPRYCLTGKQGDWQYYVQHSVPTTELGRAQGSHICYTKVTVSYGDQGENGKEDYIFSFQPNQGGNGYPFSPETSMDDFRGQLLQKNTFSGSGKLLETEINSYNLNNHWGYPTFNKIFGLKVGFLRISNEFDANGCPFLQPGYNGWQCNAKLYWIDQLWPSLASTTKISYSSSTNDSIITTVNSQYDTVNLQVSSKKTWNSKNDSLTDILKYPDGFAGTAVYDTMIARNIIAPVIENDRFYNTTLQTKQINNYQLWPIGQILCPLPVNKQVQILSNPLETRLQYGGYDTYGNLISQNLTGDMAQSYIWDYWGHFPIAQAKNAVPSDIAATSFEFDGTGNFIIASALRDTLNGFTGIQSYNLSNGSISKSGLNSAKKYILSYWSKTGSALVNGSSTTSNLSKNGWNYFEHSFSGAASLTISGTVTIDELRLYPVEAQMITYTYTPLVGISSICSPSNSCSYYEYDKLNRLLRIRDMDNNILKQYEYQYQAPAAYFNTVQSGPFTRGNCAVGGTPSTVIYTIAAGGYSSLLSQADADARAVAALAAGGPAYANANGTCTFSNAATSGNFTRSNCATGATPSTVTYTIAAGTYSSTVDQPTANQLAATALAAGGPGYANTNGTCTYYNTVQNGPFVRNNCGANSIGGSVTYTVPAHTYPSLVSQADADQQALAAGQAYANANGTCTSCTGNNHKIINNVCETGALDIISQSTSGGKCVTKYGYFFSDGSYNYDHTTSINGPCMF